ncbi:Replication factor C subunit 1 [Papilio xuthus]|uniref:Replication factor C subunit 1 n=1 Tax=Papilio xuthus TaxID=66420 RepID=A0A194PJJ6_PAPXU|nr:Replication factor C subunit 1 [Papilio xuthus]
MAFTVTKTSSKQKFKHFQDIRSFFKPKTSVKDDDSDVIPESPQMEIKKKEKKSRRKRAISDDSDEDIQKKKIQKKGTEEDLNKRKQKKSNHNTLKEVKSVDLFGDTSIKRSEPLLVKKNKKTETGIHSDDEFEMSLLELDQIEEAEGTNKSKEDKEKDKIETNETTNKKVKGNVTKPERSPIKREETSVKQERAPKEKSKETKRNVEKDRHSNDEKSPTDKSKQVNHDDTHNDDAKINGIEQKADFSEFIENTQTEEVRKGKKRKMDKSLNESVLTDEERHERKIMSAALYKNYLNRSGPKHLGAKEIPKGTPDCLKDCAFILTGVLDSFEKEDITKAINSFGGCVKSAVTKKVTHVLAGEDPGPAKMAKAEELGIKIINEDEFLQMVIDLSNKNKTTIKEEPKSAKKPKKAQSKSPTDKKEINTKVDIKEIKIKSKSDIKTEIKSEKMDISFSMHKSKSEGTSDKIETAKERTIQNPETSNTGVFKSGAQTVNSMLWVDKYKPVNVKQIIGQHGPNSNVKKLTNWLTKWYANRKAKLPKPNPWAKNDDGGFYKAALLSGPPGVGKTTTVSLVCKEMGFDVVEFNASDTRNKTLIKEQIGELLTTTSLSGYARGDTSKQAISKKHVLVMDEVDGMAGNEDRGGLQELIGLIKSTSVPIICMCNDRNSQKMRSLVNYCYDLRFNRPTVEQIKSAMMSTCFKEHIRIPGEVLSQLIVAAGQDVRQTLHLLSIWAADPNLADPERLKNDAKRIKKDVKLGPWEAVRKVFSESEHKNMTINDRSDLFFYDYSLAPLFVQENYIQVVPHCPKDKILDRLSMAADSISLGDLVDARIRGSQAWNLLPIQAMYSSVIPGQAMAGHVAGQIQFPGWLGKNSRAGKLQRLGQEIHAHTRLSTSGSKSSIFLDYAMHLRDAVVNPLLTHKADGIQQSLDILESYHLLREDLDSLIELSLWPGQRNPMILIDSKVKASMTRLYNKRASALPYAPGGVRRAKPTDNDAHDTNDLLEQDDEIDPDDKEEDSDPENDAMIKKKKVNKDKAAPKDKPSTSKEKKKKK